MEKTAKKIAKLNKQRGKKRVQQVQAEQEQHIAESLAESDSEEKKTADGPIIPEAWNCSIHDASEGTFVVLETMYARPKRRGISVAQVCLYF